MRRVIISGSFLTSFDRCTNTLLLFDFIIGFLNLNLVVKFKINSNKYDYIIFDTNPTISNLNRNVLTASDLVNIVCETQPYSLNGLKLLMDDFHSFYQSMNIRPPAMIIIPNKYEDRMSSSGEAMSLLRKNYSEIMKPDFAVRKSEDINIAAKLSLPLGVFAKCNSNAFEDILEVVNYILELTAEKLVNTIKTEAA